MADLATCAAHQPMSDYLLNTLDVPNVTMRARLIRSGFRNLDALARQRNPKEWVREICNAIRKQQGGAATKEVTMELQNNLIQLVQWALYSYMTQRALVYADATQATIDNVSSWITMLPDDTALTVSTLDKFKDAANHRHWMEGIKTYFTVKCGVTKMPLLYVIRSDPALPAVDPGFGNPDFSTELAIRGRHDGHYYRADNTTVWLFLKHLYHGTTAWPTILQFERALNGRAAFRALMAQYLGADLMALLAKEADAFVNNALFDGKSRNFTFDKFIGKFREAFLHMEHDQPMSEMRKVSKLMDAWGVDGLKHLPAIVNSVPTYNSNFYRTVTFLAD